MLNGENNDFSEWAQAGNCRFTFRNIDATAVMSVTSKKISNKSVIKAMVFLIKKLRTENIKL